MLEVTNALVFSSLVILCQHIWSLGMSDLQSPPLRTNVTYHFRAGSDINLKCGENHSMNLTLFLWRDPLNKTTSKETISLRNATVAQSGEYNCRSFYNGDLKHHQSYFIVIQDKPFPPTSIHVQALSESSMNASWVPGNSQNSPISLHTVYLHYNNSLVLKKNVSSPLSGTILHNLKPYTCYTLYARALNEIGWSEFSKPSHSLTLPGLPVVPPTVHIINVSSHSVSVDVGVTNVTDVSESSVKRCIAQDTRFQSLLHGPLVGYIVTITATQPYTFVSKTLYNASESHSQVLDISDLKPYTRYNLSFAFYNGRFAGPFSSLVVSTTEGIPGKPKITNFESSSNSLSIDWESDANTVGKTVAYKLELHTCSKNDTQSSKKLSTVQLDSKQMRFVFENLNSSTCYIIGVASATKAGFGNFSKLEVHTKFEAPSPPVAIGAFFLETNDVLVNWTCSNDCSSVLRTPQYLVCWYFQSLLSEQKCLVTQTSNKKELAYCYCDHQQQFHWTIIPSSAFKESQSGRVIFTVRSSIYQTNCTNYVNCVIQSENSNEISLNLSSAYRHFHTTPKYYFKSDNIAIVGILSITFLVFFCVVIGACFASRVRCLYIMCRGTSSCYRKTDTSTKYKRITPFHLSKSTYKVISSKEFQAYVSAYHADDDAGFQAEFESLERNVQTDWSTSVARSLENIAKNRYSNVLAYDHSRVILKETTNKSDYINANFVDGYHRRAAYIAAQGPIPSTFDDFWLMVWEQNSNIIVMISNFVERGRRKCDKYWPSSGHQTYGNISVRLISEVIRAFYTIRVFAVRHIKTKRGNKDRLVYHYQYTDWRDFDVPPSPLPVLKFVEASVTHWTFDKGPIIVHCSAGVGRTGTYICIESLIRQLKVEHAVSVCGFLEHIRQQRMKLVQTEQQYAFIHDALREYILYPCHSIRPLQFSDYLQHLYELDSTGTSNMMKQFDMCMDFGCDLVGSLYSGTPNVDHRKLPVYPSVSSGSGIDSSVLHGFLNVCEYIVTRHPLGNNISDFWKVVWDANSSLVVCLSEQSLSPFWPDEVEQTRTIGWLHINFARMDRCNDSLVRFQFLLTSDREDYALACTLLRFNAWPSVDLENPYDSGIASDLLELATHLTSDDPEFSTSSAPIVLVDNTGGYRVGIFCAIRILIGQFLNDLLLDVYFVFKMLCFQRPHLFRGYWDLEFVYILMQYYLKNEISNAVDSRYATSYYKLEGRNNLYKVSGEYHPSPKRMFGNFFSGRRRLTDTDYRLPTNLTNHDSQLFTVSRRNSFCNHGTGNNSSLHTSQHLCYSKNNRSNSFTDEYHQEEPLLPNNISSHHHRHELLRRLLSKHQSAEFLSLQSIDSNNTRHYVENQMEYSTV
ncbi:hypothetical protein MN116_003649 [Schistosoma mekongi]|uniref:protein-tyrosine-phosphatase n=1 Tax=Schistosoma mekongi TaxID=38744 RepID=A0AAE2D5S3_SCHME|nr:hypothetical protein MN116_003649 [Schistosoma mekongi]